MLKNELPSIRPNRMVFHMKTTLVIPDAVLDRLRRAAAKEGRTISELVEAALRLYLERRPATRPLPALPSFDGGGAAVNIADREALYRTMEGG